MSKEGTSNNKSTYTTEELESMYNTGALPIPKNVMKDDLTAQYTQVYNDAVNRNNAMARNRALNANSEYNEVVRNANEINKANGTANTGYAGDTSIEAYNAYRNSVNSAYNDANTANNELYNYYLDHIAQERARQDENETKVIGELETILADTYTSGYITEESIAKAKNYLTTIYGSMEDVPDSIKAYLGTKKGYAEWENNKEDYNKNVDTYELIESATTGNNENTVVGSDIGDDLCVKIKGVDYELETSAHNLTDDELNFVDKKLPDSMGSMIYYKGKLYIRDEDGGVMGVRGRDGVDTEDYNNLIEEYKNKTNGN